MERKLYEAPVVEVVSLGEADVIAASCIPETKETNPFGCAEQEG